MSDAPGNGCGTAICIQVAKTGQLAQRDRTGQSMHPPSFSIIRLGMPLPSMYIPTISVRNDECEDEH